MYRTLTLTAFILMAVSCRQDSANGTQSARPPTEAEIKEYVEKAEAEKTRVAQKEAKKNKKINALKFEMFALQGDIDKKTSRLERNRRSFFKIHQDTLVQWTLDVERGQIRVDEIELELAKMGVNVMSSSGMGTGGGSKK